MLIFFHLCVTGKKIVFETTGRGIICSERFIILICWCRVFYQVKKLAKSLPSFECSYDQQTWTQHGATLTSLHWKLYNQFSLHRFRLGGNMFQPKAFLIWIYILLALEYFSLFFRIINWFEVQVFLFKCFNLSKAEEENSKIPNMSRGWHANGIRSNCFCRECWEEAFIHKCEQNLKIFSWCNSVKFKKKIG